MTISKPIYNNETHKYEWAVEQINLAVDKLNHLSNKGSLLLSSPETTTINNATWVKIAGTFTNPREVGITGAGNKLTCDVGESGEYSVLGVSDVTVDSDDCEITYSLHKNDTDVGYHTPAGFDKKDYTKNIAICADIDISDNDYFEVFAKITGGVTTSIGLQVNTLSLMIRGS